MNKFTGENPAEEAARKAFEAEKNKERIAELNAVLQKIDNFPPETESLSEWFETLMDITRQARLADYDYDTTTGEGDIDIEKQDEGFVNWYLARGDNKAGESLEEMKERLDLLHDSFYDLCRDIYIEDPDADMGIIQDITDQISNVDIVYLGDESGKEGGKMAYCDTDMRLIWITPEDLEQIKTKEDIKKLSDVAKDRVIEGVKKYIRDHVQYQLEKLEG